MAYVAVSRRVYDAQIFTNDREKLGAALGHDVSHKLFLCPLPDGQVGVPDVNRFVWQALNLKESIRIHAITLQI